MPQPKVFISYRRSDSQAQTGRLYDRLNRAFPGMFFRDVSEIGVGVDFVAHVERAVGASVALIAVIGPQWVTASGERGRRLDDANDFVRVEVRTALARKIRIIPVLVGNAEMVTEDQLPEDLRPLTRWNAVRIVEDYYDQAIEKLVRSLVPELGEPVSDDSAPHADAKVRALRGEAEAAIGVEDWFGAIQALQAALSLEPNNFEVSARLKWANEQRKLSGLFTEAQELYDGGKKAAALQKFRQVRVAGGNYRGVNELMAQLEREVSAESRRSTVRRWTFGTVATAVGVVALLVTLVVWQIKSEFAQYNEQGGDSPPLTTGSPQPAPAPVNNPRNDVTPRPVVPEPAPQPVPPGPVEPAETPRPIVRSAIGFAPVGRFRMMREDNPQVGFDLVFNADFTFRVEPLAGIVNMPAGSGSFAYNPASGVVALSGRDTLGAGINFEIEVFESAGDHFHALAGGARWDVIPQ